MQDAPSSGLTSRHCGLKRLLGYAKWENFAKVIDKAKIACQTAGHAVVDHFPDVRKMVDIGSGAEREIDEIALTRYACYLTAQNNISLTIPGVEAKVLIHQLKNKLSFSAGSACSTVKVEPSHVLKAIGLSDDETFHTIRLGLGRTTMDAEGIAGILVDGISQSN